MDQRGSRPVTAEPGSLDPVLWAVGTTNACNLAAQLAVTGLPAH